jgi:hypothetical protein
MSRRRPSTRRCPTGPTFPPHTPIQLPPVLLPGCTVALPTEAARTCAPILAMTDRDDCYPALPVAVAAYHKPPKLARPSRRGAGPVAVVPFAGLLVAGAERPEPGDVVLVARGRRGRCEVRRVVDAAAPVVACDGRIGVVAAVALFPAARAAPGRARRRALAVGRTGARSARSSWPNDLYAVPRKSEPHFLVPVGWFTNGWIQVRSMRPCTPTGLRRR